MKPEIERLKIENCKLRKNLAEAIKRIQELLVERKTWACQCGREKVQDETETR